MKEVNLYPFRGQMFPISEISTMTGIAKETLRRRYTRAKGRTGEALDAFIASEPRLWCRDANREEATPEPGYTNEELYKIFCMFAGTVDAAEELERLSAFMGQDTPDMRAQNLLSEFRKRYKEEHSR